MQETWVRSLGWEGPLEKEMATHCSILAWKIPRTKEPGGLDTTEHTEHQRVPGNPLMHQGYSGEQDRRDLSLTEPTVSEVGECAACILSSSRSPQHHLVLH